MSFVLALALPVLALGSPVVEVVSLESRQQPPIDWTVEYRTQCKSCPFDLCTNVNIPGANDLVTLTCWTEYDVLDLSVQNP